jgi:tRNA(Ile2) C34 agmatinyltransferase TiaS
MDYKPTNREKKLAPRKELSYCPKCDRDMVSDGSKCGTCGKRKLPRRFKK